MDKMKYNICKALVLLTFTIFMTTHLYAQAPGTPGGHGSSGNESGGSAPIGSGLMVLTVLGAGWAGYKVRESYKK